MTQTFTFNQDEVIDIIAIHLHGKGLLNGRHMFTLNIIQNDDWFECTLTATPKSKPRKREQTKRVDTGNPLTEPFTS